MQRSPKPISTAQMMGILVFTLALFFLVAFATKSVEAYRLRNWLARLQRERAALERQREELVLELQRRQSMAWVDETLRQAGLVPTDVIRVIVLTATPQLASTPAPAIQATPTPTQPPLPEQKRLFNNPTWQAWQHLLWGRE